MGNSQLQKSSFEQNNWRCIEQKQKMKILYNDITMKSVQRHEAELDCDEGEAISMCKWRQSLPQESNIIDLYQFGIKKAGMCKRKSQIYVITQRIHLLSEIGSISRPQAFLILKNVVTGLQVLFRKFGNFDPKPNIIGINNQGRPKVWVNQNFAVAEQQKNNSIPIPSTQFEIVNNLIRILQHKISDDHSYQIDFPKNLDFNSVVGYVNKVFTSLNGFSINQVYVDRAQFRKRHSQIKQRQLLDQQSRMRAAQAQRRLLQIQILRQNLRRQQFQFAQKERQLRLQRHLQTKNTSMIAVGLQNNQIISDNSQGKILKGTVSTFKSEALNSRLIPVNPTNLNIQTYHQGFIQPYQNTQMSRLNEYNQTHLTNYFKQPPIGIYFQQQSIPQVRNIQSLSKPPLPSKQIPQARPQSNRNLKTDNTKQNNNLRSQQNIRKQIEMIDSMVMMREDSAQQDKDKKFIESRIITYQL